MDIETITDRGGSWTEYYQLNGNKYQPSEFEGERRLWMAVLLDTIRTIQTGPPRGYGKKRKIYNEAIWWVQQTDGVMDGHGFSFDDVCGILNLDFKLLRTVLLRWAARHGAMPIPTPSSGFRARSCQLRIHIQHQHRTRWPLSHSRDDAQRPHQ